MRKSLFFVFILATAPVFAAGGPIDLVRVNETLKAVARQALADNRQDRDGNTVLEFFALKYNTKKSDPANGQFLAKGILGLRTSAWADQETTALLLTLRGGGEKNSVALEMKLRTQVLAFIRLVAKGDLEDSTRNALAAVTQGEKDYYNDVCPYLDAIRSARSLDDAFSHIEGLLQVREAHLTTGASLPESVLFISKALNSEVLKAVKARKHGQVHLKIGWPDLDLDFSISETSLRATLMKGAFAPGEMVKNLEDCADKLSLPDHDAVKAKWIDDLIYDLGFYLGRAKEYIVHF